MSIYLSDHSQPKEEPDHTDKSGKHFFAVAAPQVVRIQIHNGGHNTLDTYKLNVWRNRKKSVIADSRRKVWEKIIKETVREASVVYNGRCPLTRFWREIASALYIPQMSKRLSDHQRPSLPNSYWPPSPPPPSISSPSMLFCMVTFAFKKIEREEGERTLSWTLSWRSIPTNYFWECWSMKKTLTIWNSLGNHSNAFLFMCMRSNNCIFFCSFDTALINLSTRESTFDRWKICTKVYLAIYSNNPRLHSKLNW